jgi:hypothetical protein
MDRQTACELLGVSGDADRDQLRRAYLRLVKRHPPDRDREQFLRIRTAYDLLRGEEFNQLPLASDSCSSLPDEMSVATRLGAVLGRFAEGDVVTARQELRELGLWLAEEEHASFSHLDFQTATWWKFAGELDAAASLLRPELNRAMARAVLTSDLTGLQAEWEHPRNEITERQLRRFRKVAPSLHELSSPFVERAVQTDRSANWMAQAALLSLLVLGISVWRYPEETPFFWLPSFLPAPASSSQVSTHVPSLSPSSMLDSAAGDLLAMAEDRSHSALAAEVAILWHHASSDDCQEFGEKLPTFLGMVEDLTTFEPDLSRVVEPFLGAACQRCDHELPPLWDGVGLFEP